MSTNKPCPTGEIQAYHDGELDAARRQAVAAHLAGCQPCSLMLAELVAMSSLFASAPLPRLSQMSMHRLHNKIEEAMERGLLRIAWTISGIAASILVGGSILLSTMNSMKRPMPVDQPSAVASAVETPPWIGASVSADTDTADTLAQNSATPVAQWYLSNPSGHSDDSQQ
jgi:anti-sigma factor RsiW